MLRLSPVTRTIALMLVPQGRLRGEMAMRLGG